MKLLALLCIFGALAALSSAGRIVCYFTSWTIYRTGDGKFQASDVDPTLCTHVVYSFLSIYENGSVRILDDWEFTGLMEVTHLQSLKTDNPDLNLMVSLGGSSEGSATFSQIAADPELRANLVESALTFLETYEFDGFDLDWEYPAQGNGSDPENDPANYVTLLTELHEALSAANYTFSVGASGVVDWIPVSYPDGLAITDVVDFVNIKTYDYHGSWEDVTGHFAPLYAATADADPNLNVAASIEAWLSTGADPAKLNLGLGTYGRPFTLLDLEDNGLGAPANGSGALGPLTNEEGIWGFNEICSAFADYERVWDEEQQVPYKVSGDQWVGYEDEESFQVKVEYANEQGLGGVNLWSLDTDDFLGSCGNVTYPLLRVINANLN